MSHFVTRALLPGEHSAFAEFECSNREAFEQFNEPQPNRYYSSAGLLQAFERHVALQASEQRLTRITTHVDRVQWVAKGSLTAHHIGQDHFATLVYQTDRGHWNRGAGGALLADLILQAQRLRLPRVEALIAADNLVSLHLLRRSGFTTMGWADVARLQRGRVDCLRLGRSVRRDEGLPLPRANVQFPT